jgi:hypothetical protein
VDGAGGSEEALAGALDDDVVAAALDDVDAALEEVGAELVVAGAELVVFGASLVVSGAVVSPLSLSGAYAPSAK